RGWTKFEDDQVADAVMVKIADGVKLPEREALSDPDPKSWKETDGDGKPRDPWVKQWYLPLTSVDIGDFCCFVTSSAGGNSAIANLCRVNGNRQDGLLPIIALRTRSYKHRQYGRIETPDLAITGWHGIPKKIERPSVGDEMNDHIPF